MTALTLEDALTALTIEDGTTALTLEDDGAPFLRPSLTVEVAFETDPLATPFWLDITRYVKSVNTTTGRSQEVDDFQAGTVTLTLDNSDRRFDPRHTFGPYYGDLKPRRRIRISATHDWVTVVLFVGFVDGWPQTTFRPPETAETTITATDLFVLLANIDLPRSVYAIEVEADSPTIWYPFNDTTGDVCKDDSGNDYHADYNYEPVHRNGESLVFGDALSSNRVRAGSPGAAQDPLARRSATAGIPVFPMSVEYWLTCDDPTVEEMNGQYDATVFELGTPTQFVYGGVTFDFIGSGSGTGLYFAYFDCGSSDSSIKALNTTTSTWPLSKGPHHIALTTTVANGSPIMYINGAVVDSIPGIFTWGDLGGRGLYLGGNRLNDRSWFEIRFDEFALYDIALSPTRLAAHYTAGTNPWAGDRTGARINRILDLCDVDAALRDIDTGVVTLGPTALATDALSYCKSIEATEGGQFYVAHQEGGRLKFRDANSLASDIRRRYPQATFTDQPDFTAATWDVSLWDTGLWATPFAVRYEPDTLRFEESEQSVVNEVSVSWDAGTETWDDASSRTTYGRKSQSVATRLKTSGEAKLRAIALVERYKDAKVQVSGLSVNLAGLKDDTQLSTVLGLRIGDRVTVRFHPQMVGTAVELDAHIEGIADTIDTGVNVWDRSFALSLAL